MVRKAIRLHGLMYFIIIESLTFLLFEPLNSLIDLQRFFFMWGLFSFGILLTNISAFDDNVTLTKISKAIDKGTIVKTRLNITNNKVAVRDAIEHPVFNSFNAVCTISFTVNILVYAYLNNIQL